MPSLRSHRLTCTTVTLKQFSFGFWWTIKINETFRSGSNILEILFSIILRNGAITDNQKKINYKVQGANSVWKKKNYHGSILRLHNHQWTGFCGERIEEKPYSKQTITILIRFIEWIANESIYFSIYLLDRVLRYFYCYIINISFCSLYWCLIQCYVFYAWSYMYEMVFFFFLLERCSA